MKTFREIAEMHYIAEANNEVDKQYRLNRIDALEKLLTEECEEKMKEAIELLKAWEQWDADFLMGDEHWGETLPKFSQQSFDKYCDLYAKRYNYLTNKK